VVDEREVVGRAGVTAFRDPVDEDRSDRALRPRLPTEDEPEGDAGTGAPHFGGGTLAGRVVE
jgi:hypothetical protein